MNTINNLQDVMDYYRRVESRLGYLLLLKGTRHFGYYPERKSDYSFEQAQREMERRLGTELDLPKDSLVLDAGCGEGHVAIFLARQFGYRLEGIDLLEPVAGKATRNVRRAGLSDRIHVRVGDYTTYQWQRGTFDGIFTMETFVHIAAYDQALQHFYAILKPGGRLVMHEYSMTPPQDLSLKQASLWTQIINGMGMYGLPHFHHGVFGEIIARAGFIGVEVEDITARVLPMFASFHRTGVIPYRIIKLLGLQHKFVNALFGVEGYEDIIKHGTWRYNVITARKK